MDVDNDERSASWKPDDFLPVHPIFMWKDQPQRNHRWRSNFLIRNNTSQMFSFKVYHTATYRSNPEFGLVKPDKAVCVSLTMAADQKAKRMKQDFVDVHLHPVPSKDINWRTFWRKAKSSSRTQSSRINILFSNSNAARMFYESMPTNKGKSSISSSMVGSSQNDSGVSLERSSDFTNSTELRQSSLNNQESSNASLHFNVVKLPKWFKLKHRRDFQLQQKQEAEKLESCDDEQGTKSTNESEYTSKDKDNAESAKISEIELQQVENGKSQTYIEMMKSFTNNSNESKETSSSLSNNENSDAETAELKDLENQKSMTYIEYLKSIRGTAVQKYEPISEDEGSNVGSIPSSHVSLKKRNVEIKDSKVDLPDDAFSLPGFLLMYDHDNTSVTSTTLSQQLDYFNDNNENSKDSGAFSNDDPPAKPTTQSDIDSTEKLGQGPVASRSKN